MITSFNTGYKFPTNPLNAITAHAPQRTIVHLWRSLLAYKVCQRLRLKGAMCGYPLFYLAPGTATSHEGITAVPPCAYMWVCEVYAQGVPVSYEACRAGTPGASFLSQKWLFLTIFDHFCRTLVKTGDPIIYIYIYIICI